MSASSSRTLAPLRPSAQARLIATVDLPTPPLPEATAIACLTPGMTWLGFGRLKAERTLDVIVTSTTLTPGRSATSFCASVWKRSLTGQAGVVRSNMKLTRPSLPMTSSLIMPRLTTSRPRSGSWIAESTARTWSEVGGLLGTEDHRRAQRQHSDQDGDGNGKDVGGGAGDDRRAAARKNAQVPPRRNKRGRDAAESDQPQREQGQGSPRGAGGVDGDEEQDQHDQLEDREIRLGFQNAGARDSCLRPVSREKCDQSRGAAES